jgi:hypothetical protein
MEKKQTAVQWVMDKMLQNENSIFIGGRYLTLYEIRERAKVRERAQMIEFANKVLYNAECSFTGRAYLEKDIDEIYNEIYGIGH